jgi:2,3-bisphosphoglycerate-dependent phosphoglycerate mutase
MKTILIFNLDALKTRPGMLWCALLGGVLSWLLLGCATPPGEVRPVRETTVWVVRHAEKTSAEVADPPLSALGQARAEALARRLRGEGVEAIFVSPTLRTRATAEPLARGAGKEPLSYAAKDYVGLRERIRKEFQGRTVLVVGHSNTVLEILEALGAPRPMPALADEDYDYLFRVSLPETGAATVKTVQYGAAHRQ